MKQINLNKNLTIYYDIDKKIIGRIPTISNLIRRSDNSLYFGKGNTLVDNIFCSIFSISDLHEINKKTFDLKFFDDDIKIEFNLNHQGQRQLHFLNEGRMGYIIDKYKKINSVESVEDYIIFLNFDNNTLFLKHKNDINSITTLEEKQLEEVVKKAYKQAQNENIDVNSINAYIESHINIRNSEVQKKFKNDLFKEFGSCCALCSINKEELLIASHILPYHLCTSAKEMMDSNNGLLLCVNHDSLFDKRFISFDYNTGKISISKEIDEKMYDLLNINETINLNDKYMTDKRRKYLASHKIK